MGLDPRSSLSEESLIFEFGSSILGFLEGDAESLLFERTSDDGNFGLTISADMRVPAEFGIFSIEYSSVEFLLDDLLFIKSPRLSDWVEECRSLDLDFVTSDSLFLEFCAALGMLWENVLFRGTHSRA